MTTRRALVPAPSACATTTVMTTAVIYSPSLVWILDLWALFWAVRVFRPATQGAKLALSLRLKTIAA